MADAALKPGKHRDVGVSGLIGMAFDAAIRLPWWIFLPAVAAILWMDWRFYIRPSFYERTWQVPSYNQVLISTGTVESRVGTRSPFHFDATDGTHLILWCEPLRFRFQDCLDRASASSAPIKISYFVAHDRGTEIPTVMSAKGASGTILDFDSQARNLNIVAKIEDQNAPYGPLLPVVLSFFLILFVLAAMGVKLSGKKRHARSAAI